MKDGYIVGLGEILWDCLPTGKKLGGAPANFAYHVSRLGLKGIVASAVGNDSLGDEAISELESHAVPYCIERVKEATGTVLVSLDKKGVPSYDIRQGVAWDNIRFSPKLKALAAETAAVCFGSLAQRNNKSRKTIRQFLESVPADSLKIFDINIRQDYYSLKLIEESLHMSDILKINDEEISLLAKLAGIPGRSFDEMCRVIMYRYGLDMIILTCGEAGSYIFSPRQKNYMETPKVEVVDTVGAGDAFTAAFVAAILLGKSVEEAHEAAVKLSAFVCTQKGAMHEIPEEYKRLL